MKKIIIGRKGNKKVTMPIKEEPSIFLLGERRMGMSMMSHRMDDYYNKYFNKNA